MTTKILLSFGIAALLVAVGPGIGVAGNPGDASARWVDGLLLLGATVRIAPALAPMAIRRSPPEGGGHGAPVVVSPEVFARTEAQRRRYQAGVLPAAYGRRADAVERRALPQGDRAVGTLIAYI